MSSFFGIFKDNKGIIRKVEISNILYEQFNRVELDELSELNEMITILNMDKYMKKIYTIAFYIKKTVL